MILLTVLITLLLGNVDGHSSGAGAGACNANAMVPGHSGHSGQTDRSPYSVIVSETQYTAGGSITVTLTGTKAFKGFLVLAVPVGFAEASVGSFEADNSSESALVQERCDGKGLTHTSKDAKSELKLKWSAPDPPVGNVRFYVTFVEEFVKFWVKVQSPEVTGAGTYEPPTQGPVTDPPILKPVISDETCAVEKSCYSDCEGSKCGFLLTWKKMSGTLVEFELFATLRDNENYVALGLSKVAKMEDVSIVACVANEKSRISNVQELYAAGRQVPTSSTAGPLDKSLSEAAISTVSGSRTMSCRFTYDNAQVSPAQWKDLEKSTNLYAFIARGPAFSDAISKHSVTPLISPQTIDFFSDTHINIGGSLINPLIKAHGCIMILAWVFCASIGVILARYYKPMFADSKACGQKVWFSYHRILMLCAMFLTIIGFILILVHNDGVFRTPEKLPTKAHPILGLIAIIFALLNPLIAAFRCHPGEAKRPIFNWVHWFVGTVAHVFAITAIITGSLFVDIAAVPHWLWYIPIGFAAYHLTWMSILEIFSRVMIHKSHNEDAVAGPKLSQPTINKVGPAVNDKVVAIFLGLLIESASVPDWITYVMMAFCLFHVCVEFILEIHQCCMYDKNRDRQEEHQLSNKSGDEPKYAGRGFKCAMLAIYLVVVCLITIALIVLVALGGSVISTK